MALKYNIQHLTPKLTSDLSGQQHVMQQTQKENITNTNANKQIIAKGAITTTHVSYGIGALVGPIVLVVFPIVLLSIIIVENMSRSMLVAVLSGVDVELSSIMVADSVMLGISVGTIAVVSAASVPPVAISALFDALLGVVRPSSVANGSVVSGKAVLSAGVVVSVVLLGIPRK